MFDNGLSQLLQDRPLVALGTLFGAGVLTSLTPCIYPMIPITASLISGTARTANGDSRVGRKRTVALTFMYVTGLAMFYALMGLVAGLTGTLFGTVASSPWARLGTAALLLVFGLAMLDLIPISAPRRVIQWASGLGGGSYPAVFLLGASSGIVAAPCGAPAFAVVLTWVATTQSALWGFIYLFVFSLGMTALLVAVGLFSGAATLLPRAGPWMVWVKKGAGILILGTAGYYLLQAAQVLGWWPI